jgi:uncharacterized membrane protein YfcA
LGAPVAIAELVGIALLGVVSGLMIGCVGIGGVILVPALVFLGDIPIQIGIPAAMLAYILSGLVATTVFAQNKSIDWGMAAWLCAGATPTALAGAWAVSVDKMLLIVGAMTGFLSSISGTGGPLVLVPILISMSLPVLASVGLSQAIQLPVAIAATVGNVLYGELDLALGGVLAASLTVGSWYGAKLAHVVPRATLRRIVSVVLVMVGVFILGNVAWRLLR